MKCRRVRLIGSGGPITIGGVNPAVHSFSEAEMEAVWEDVLEHLLDTLLTPTLYGIAARIAWMEIVANKYSSRNIEKDLACLSALRADFAAFSASVQTGRSQTETQRRAAVIDRLRDHTATIALDPAVFPRGCYEIEMQRGAAFLAASHSAASYTYGGTVWDFWGVQGSPGLIVMSRDQVLDTLYILRSVSIC